EGRIAFANTASLGKRVEGEGLVQLWLTRRLDASADVRIGAGDRVAPGHLDAVRLDGNARPLDTLSFTGGFRYEGLSIPELDGPERVSAARGRAALLAAGVRAPLLVPPRQRHRTRADGRDRSLRQRPRAALPGDLAAPVGGGAQPSQREPLRARRSVDADRLG